MLVAAVAGVDHRDTGITGRAQRRAFLGVAHGCDVGIARDDADGIRYAFPLGCGRGVGACKAEHRAAKVEHRRLKGKTGAGGWFIKQGCELFVHAHILESRGVGRNPVGQAQQGINFLNRKVERVN